MPLELFRINCVTCSAQLAVHDRSAIGKILACPRCNSMVEITEPAASIGSKAAGATTTSELETPAVALEVGSSADATELAPSAAGEIAVGAASRRIVAWSLAGLVVGASLVVAIALREDGSPTEERRSPSVEPNPAIVTQPPAVEAPATSDAPEEIATAEFPPVPTDSPPQLPAEETQTSVPKPQPSIQDTTATEMPTETVAAEPALPAQEADPEPAQRRFDPLEFDPQRLDLSQLDAPRLTESEAANANDVAAEVPVEDMTPTASPSPSQRVRRNPDSSSPELPPDAEQQLAQVLPALQFDGMPLTRFLEMISRLANVPVSIGPEQLLMAGAVANTAVSLDAQEVRLDEALQSALQPLKLKAVPLGPHVVLVREGSDKVREIDYPIDDLVSEEFPLETLADWVVRLVAPTSWQQAGGAGTLDASPNSLHVKQSQHIHYQVLFFLERLRLARELAPRSKFPTERLAGPGQQVTLAEKLGGPTTFTFSHYTPLREIFSHWQQELDVAVLVDWPALNELGLWPQSEFACSANNQPWQQAFDELLEPMGLGWRTVTPQALEITTAEKAADELQLKLYRLQPAAREKGSELVASAQSQLPQHSTDGTAVEYDSIGNVLIVLQPATAQRRIKRWLAEQGLMLAQ